MLFGAIVLGASLSNCLASWNIGYISEFECVVVVVVVVGVWALVWHLGIHGAFLSSGLMVMMIVAGAMC